MDTDNTQFNNQELPQENQANEMPMNEADEPKAFGPIIGILIIVALLAFGGLYFYGAHLLKQQNTNQTDTSATTSSFQVETANVNDGGSANADAEFNALFNATSTSTGSSSNQLDDFSDLNSIDSELNTLETNL